MKILKGIKSITSIVNNRITETSKIAPEFERHYIVESLYSSSVSILYHSILIPSFILTGVYPMAVLNITFSIPMWLIVFRSIKRYKYTLALIISCLEMLVHMTLSIYLVGFQAGFQIMYIGIILTFFQVPRRFKHPSTLLIFLLMPTAWIGLKFYYLTNDPVYIIEPSFLLGFYSANIISIIIFISMVMGILVFNADNALKNENYERNRADKLLLNILPPSIADRLKGEDKTIADGFTDASIFFCDIVDFTVMSATLTPSEVVSVLNNLFTRIDGLLEQFSMEKIKTIGDAYMAACGIPLQIDNHADNTIRFALAVQHILEDMNSETGFNIKLRYGVNSGPVVAGVIGKKKYIYDLWGDTVNTASRMESHGAPDRIQVTESTYQLLKNNYEFQCRGDISVKGKGVMKTYFLDPNQS